MVVIPNTLCSERSPCAIFLADVDRLPIPVALLHNNLLAVPVAVGEHALFESESERSF